MRARRLRSEFDAVALELVVQVIVTVLPHAVVGAELQLLALREPGICWRLGEVSELLPRLGRWDGLLMARRAKLRVEIGLGVERLGLRFCGRISVEDL